MSDLRHLRPFNIQNAVRSPPLPSASLFPLLFPLLPSYFFPLFQQHHSRTILLFFFCFSFPSPVKSPLLPPPPIPTFRFTSSFLLFLFPILYILLVLIRFLHLSEQAVNKALPGKQCASVAQLGDRLRY